MLLYKLIEQGLWPVCGEWEQTHLHGAGRFGKCFCLLNTGREIDNEASEADDVYPCDDLGFGSYANMNCAVILLRYLEF